MTISTLPLVPPQPDLAFRAVLAGLYEGAAEDSDPHELRRRACRGLAASFGFALAMLVRKASSGIAVCEATSAESQLWLALQRLPERWDGSLVGEGPAARLLRSGEPKVRIRIEDDEFFPWRAAARAEGVQVAAALPLNLPAGAWALELFGGEDTLPEEFGEPLRRAIGALERFLRNLETQQTRRLLACALESTGNAAFLTDREGTIVWANEAFARLSGHSREQIVGSNPRVLQSGKQGIRYYRDLWNTIRSGKIWVSDTVDRDRAGAPYVIRQTISPVAVGDRYTHYLSLQTDITREKAVEREHALRAGRDDTTQLLTRPAFEEAVAAALERRPDATVLVGISARSLFQSLAGAPDQELEAVAAEIGDRMLTVVEAPALGPACAGVASRGEYLVLLQGDAAAETRVAGLIAELKAALEDDYPLANRSVRGSFQFASARATPTLNTVDAMFRALDRGFPALPAANARRRIPGA